MGKLTLGQMGNLTAGHWLFTDRNCREIHQQTRRFIAEQYGFACIILLTLIGLQRTYTPNSM